MRQRRRRKVCESGCPRSVLQYASILSYDIFRVFFRAHSFINAVVYCIISLAFLLIQLEVIVMHAQYKYHHAKVYARSLYTHQPNNENHYLVHCSRQDEQVRDKNVRPGLPALQKRKKRDPAVTPNLSRGEREKE